MRWFSIFRRNDMEKIYEGKAKEVYSTDNSEYIIKYKDTATSGNGKKEADILGKNWILQLQHRYLRC